MWSFWTITKLSIEIFVQITRTTSLPLRCEHTPMDFQYAMTVLPFIGSKFTDPCSVGVYICLRNSVYLENSNSQAIDPSQVFLSRRV